jgi:hypothetical protein
MSLPICVDAWSGYKANERPRQFVLDEEVYEIAAVLAQWYERAATYFKVRTTDDKTYILRYDHEADEWTLQSGFDGDELMSRPGIELVRTVWPCGELVHRGGATSAMWNRCLSPEFPARKLRIGSRRSTESKRRFVADHRING